MAAPLVFLDTETTGLGVDDEIWEFAAVLRRRDGTEIEVHEFVEHDVERALHLPEQFRADHAARYKPERSLWQHEFADALADIFPETDDYAARSHVVGAVPNFDTERLARLMRRHGHEPCWHHHLIDVETLAVGWLKCRMHYDAPGHPDSWSPPWDSEVVSLAVGVDPDRFERHTALGDVRWAMAIYDAVMGH